MALIDRRREEAKQEIERRGLRCVQYGSTWHIQGIGVDLSTSDLGYVDAKSLEPYQPSKKSSEEW